MNGIRNNIAVLILALPMMFLILHDIIPHHHHHQIHSIECSHNHHADHQNLHDGCCSDEDAAHDTSICQACQFETEFTLDNSFSRISAIIPFVLIHFEDPAECNAEVIPDYMPETYQGYSLSKFLRGPPSC